MTFRWYFLPPVIALALVARISLHHSSASVGESLELRIAEETLLIPAAYVEGKPTQGEKPAFFFFAFGPTLAPLPDDALVFLLRPIPEAVSRFGYYPIINILLTPAPRTRDLQALMISAANVYRAEAAPDGSYSTPPWFSGSKHSFRAMASGYAHCVSEVPNPGCSLYFSHRSLLVKMNYSITNFPDSGDLIPAARRLLDSFSERSP
ncbi:hypothetical protein GCM10007036_10610 [Alsobacter metallidurans]|uniref:Uncharacterized protein n=1 Tax=Alsobacter metallidurans TaxID=340221 RepID=A0A917I5S2_9HYPH|nr:hypothetical protein [Alsobacter metallidurans]GGH12620.1 hypothetical protein GCM10007036_10610 [Alsobacter metallidurans]